MMENYSLSDISAVTGAGRGNELFGGNGLIILILFLLFFGMGRNGYGNGGNCMPNCGCDSYVTTSQFESENNFRTLDNSNRMTQNGLCQLGYEQANLINSSTAQIVANITNEGRGLERQIADCCCTTQRAIDSVKFENCQNTQKILDALTTNRMDDMQNQINQLQLSQALCGVPRVNPYGYGITPTFPNCCGCNC